VFCHWILTQESDIPEINHVTLYITQQKHQHETRQQFINFAAADNLQFLEVAVKEKSHKTRTESN